MIQAGICSEDEMQSELDAVYFQKTNIEEKNYVDYVDEIALRTVNSINNWNDNFW